METGQRKTKATKRHNFNESELSSLYLVFLKKTLFPFPLTPVHIPPKHFRYTKSFGISLKFPGIFLSFFLYFLLLQWFLSSIICQECLSCVWWIAGCRPLMNLMLSFVYFSHFCLQFLVGFKHFSWFCVGILDHWSLLLVKVTKWDCAFLQHPRNWPWL